MTDHLPDQPPVLQVSDAALVTVLDVRAAEANPSSLALWIETSGASGDEFNYELYFQAASDAQPGDWSWTFTGPPGALPVVVPAASVPNLRGAHLEVQGDGPQATLAIVNPNHPPAPPLSPAMAGPVADLTGDLATRILAVLDQRINPAIAAHGGRADLVAVEQDIAYLRLSGGCAGCGLAAVTLSQGIEVTLRESVPEISRVVDVTDHAAGTNPYYEPAKK